MRSCRSFWFAAGLVAGIVVMVSGHARRHASAATEQPPAGPSPRASQVLEEARELRERREAVLRDLAGVLSSEGTAGLSERELLEALQLIGDLHVSDPAVLRALHGHLYLGLPERGLVRVEPWRLFPGFDALAKVGLPAMPLLVDEIRTDDDYEHRHLAAVFLGTVVGRHAESWLSQALEAERDETARARLQQALKQRPYRGNGAYDTDIFLFRIREKRWYYPEEGK